MSSELVKISFPTQFVPALQFLASIDNKHLEQFRSRLKEIPPTLTNAEIVDQLALSGNFDAKLLSLTVEFLSSIYVLQTELDRDMSQVLEALGESIERISDKAISQSQKAAARERIIALTQCDDALAYSSKARDLAGTRDNVLVSSRLITDIRPVFSTTVTAPPVCFAFVHTLKLAFKQGSETRETFFGLDSSDLIALKDLVERALQKEATLKSELQEHGLRIIHQ